MAATTQKTKNTPRGQMRKKKPGANQWRLTPERPAKSLSPHISRISEFDGSIAHREVSTPDWPSDATFGSLFVLNQLPWGSALLQIRIGIR